MLAPVPSLFVKYDEKHSYKTLAFRRDSLLSVFCKTAKQKTLKRFS